MEDPSFKLNGIHILNVILEYFYVGLLLMCFILALGNRPQGSKWGYTLAFIGFALITIYMTVSLDFADQEGSLYCSFSSLHSSLRLRAFRISNIMVAGH
jgi:chitin synthase